MELKKVKQIALTLAILLVPGAIPATITYLVVKKLKERKEKK